MSSDSIRARLDERLTSEGRTWLVVALGRLATAPVEIGTLFPAAGRRCGRGQLVPTPGDDPELAQWTVDDAARALLLLALPLRPDALAGEVDELYRYGDAAEKRGVLRALDPLDRARELADRTLPLVREALRANDTRLVAAALGPYGARHLDASGYRQGVLKCAFLGIPLVQVGGLPERADAELARMLVDFARERVAAGRDVPPEVWPLIDRHPRVVETSGITAELASEIPARREAARRALAARTYPPSHRES